MTQTAKGLRKKDWPWTWYHTLKQQRAKFLSTLSRIPAQLWSPTHLCSVNPKLKLFCRMKNLKETKYSPPKVKRVTVLVSSSQDWQDKKKYYISHFIIACGIWYVKRKTLRTYFSFKGEKSLSWRSEWTKIHFTTGYTYKVVINHGCVFLL